MKRVRNWRNYNESLVRRGSITFWFTEECIEEWRATKKTSGRGRPQKYSNAVIECALTLKAWFKQTFRAVEGFIRSIVQLLCLKLSVPTYTLLCKRQKTISIKLPQKPRDMAAPVNILVDTTGLKVYGEGEWKVKKHGTIKHRLWRKLHLAVNEESQAIEAFALTDLGVQDCEGLGLLTKQIKTKIGTCKGDGSYDSFRCYETGAQGNFELIAPPQKNARTSRERTCNKKKASHKAVLQRDWTIQQVRQLGLQEWKKKINYHRRSLAETAMFRIKTLLGAKLTTRKLEHQKIEMAIWCKIINQITDS